MINKNKNVLKETILFQLEHIEKELEKEYTNIRSGNLWNITHISKEIEEINNHQIKLDKKIFFFKKHYRFLGTFLSKKHVKEYAKNKKRLHELYKEKTVYENRVPENICITKMWLILFPKKLNYIGYSQQYNYFMVNLN